MGCGDNAVPGLQIVRGFLAPEGLPFGASRIRALDANLETSALDILDENHRFTLVLPPGKSYLLEALGGDPADRFSHHAWTLRVCAAMPPVELGDLVHLTACPRDASCQQTLTEARACLAHAGPRCVELIEELQSCRSHLDAECGGHVADLNQCLENRCEWGENEEQGGCGPGSSLYECEEESDALLACHQQWSCEGRQSVLDLRCPGVWTCFELSKSAEAVCGSDEKDPGFSEIDPADCRPKHLDHPAEGEGEISGEVEHFLIGCDLGSLGQEESRE